MHIGYARVSKTDGTQTTHLQRDALIGAGVEPENLFEDQASGRSLDRPGLALCLRTLRKGDTFLVWKLDRLGRNLQHLLQIVRDLEKKEIGFRVLSGSGAEIDTSTANGRLIFGIFASLSEFEHELIKERTRAGLAAARARGRRGGGKWKMTPLKIEIARAVLSKRSSSVSTLCKELKITRQTLYRYLSPEGDLRDYGKRMLINPKDSCE